jgi:hypothetical protein
MWPFLGEERCREEKRERDRQTDTERERERDPVASFFIRVQSHHGDSTLMTSCKTNNLPKVQLLISSHWGLRASTDEFGRDSNMKTCGEWRRRRL